MNFSPAPKSPGKLLYDSYPTFVRDLIITLIIMSISIAFYFILGKIHIVHVHLLRASAGFFILLSSFMLGFFYMNNLTRIRIYQTGVRNSTYQPKGEPQDLARSRSLGKRFIDFNEVKNIYPATTSTRSGQYLKDIGIILVIPHSKYKEICSYISVNGNQTDKLIEIVNLIKERLRDDWKMKYSSTELFFTQIEGYDDPEMKEIVDFFIKEWSS